MWREPAVKEMKVRHFVVGPIATNCYLVINENTKELIVIDPGDEAQRLIKFIDDGGYKPVVILYTHGHFDHVEAGEELHEKYGIPRLMGEGDRSIISDPRSNCSYLTGREKIYEYDRDLHDSEEISCAGFNIKVIATPGHTKGGVCFYFYDEGVLFSGDTLFCEGVGRTDFVSGSMSQIVRSIREKLFTLPDLTVVYPGHGEPTKIGCEKENNYYVAL